LKRTVAVKVLLPSLSANKQSLGRFKQEGRAASRLNHPNIVKVLEYGIVDKVLPYMVMDYVPGKSLADLLSEQKVLDIETTIDLMIQSCAALKHAHANNVVHRDLKPSNMMLTTDDSGKQLLKLVDFGIAKILSSEGTTSLSLTQTGEVFGSPLYMSPEQGLGR